jgi:hypothetical protein
MSGRDRILDFNPTDRWIGKNPGQWAPFKVPPPGKAQNFLAELFDEGRKALGRIGAASADVAQQVIDWRANIQTFSRAEEFNRAIPIIKDLSAILRSQVSDILMAAAREKAIPFDSNTRSFVHIAKESEKNPAMATLFGGAA